MMNAYRNQPLGLDWYRLLSIYSELGSSTNSYDKICDIGQELKNLDGKHDAAIQGINEKLDSLIQAGNVKLSGKDLSSLKEAVVQGLAKHAEKSADQCAAPVVSDGESLIFTGDVNKVLASLVQQKADLKKMADIVDSIDQTLVADATRTGAEKAVLDQNVATILSEISHIKSRLDQGISMTKADADAFHKWHEKIQKGVADAAGGNNPGPEALAARRDALAEAVVAKMGSADSTLLSTALARAIAEKMGTRGGCGSLSEAEKDALATSIAKKVGTGGGRSSRAPSATASNIIPPDGFDEELHKMSTEDVLKLFDAKDSRLYVAGEDYRSIIGDEYEYMLGSTEYNTEEDLTLPKIYEHINKRYKFTPEKTGMFTWTTDPVRPQVDLLLLGETSDICMIRYLHTYLINSNLDNVRT